MALRDPGCDVGFGGALPSLWTKVVALVVSVVVCPCGVPPVPRPSVSPEVLKYAGGTGWWTLSRTPTTATTEARPKGNQESL